MGNVRRIDHIAIAVRSIEESRQTFEALYGEKYLGQRENVEQQYVVAYFLLGEGIQHVGVEVADLDALLETLEAGGARVSNHRVLPGIRKEALVSPRSAFGMILQPIEWAEALQDEPHHERILKAGGI